MSLSAGKCKQCLSKQYFPSSCSFVFLSAAFLSQNGYSTLTEKERGGINGTTLCVSLYFLLSATAAEGEGHKCFCKKQSVAGKKAIGGERE